MVNPIPNFANKVWSKWNIRAVILTSFLLQIILNFLATFRKGSKNPLLVMLLWCTYLLADFTAIYCIGLISNKYGDKDMHINSVDDFLLAFWAPFLLLHLGGPDTITAFAFEDNELWLRHMFGLIVQVSLTGYTFLLTLPQNTLWLPTALIFMAGIIKFSERIRSLKLASISNFRQSMFRQPDRRSNYPKLIEELKSRIDAGLPSQIVTMPRMEDQFQNKESEEQWLDDVDIIWNAYRFFDTFKGLIVDTIYSLDERNDSHHYFHQLTPVDALKVIEVELNLYYEAFYTKASVICSKVGLCLRFVSVCSVVAALMFFVYDQKHGCDEFDIKVTYTLLYGAVALDVVSLLMLISSDHLLASFFYLDSQNNYSDSGMRTSKLAPILSCFLQFKRPKWKEKRFKKTSWLKNRSYKILRRRVLSRRWPECISGSNLISYCLHKRKRWNWLYNFFDLVGCKELAEQWKYEKKQPLFQKLWMFIFTELERKSGDAYDVETIQRICSSRGEWVIQEGKLLLEDIGKLMPYVEPNNVTFDECLILWHIATDLLFYEDEHSPDVEKGSDDGYLELQDFSKLLSDYMLYLLNMQPTMMSAVRGNWETRFQDTCTEATNLFPNGMMEFPEGEKSPSKLKLLNFIIKVLNSFSCLPIFFQDKEEYKTKMSRKACQKLSGMCVGVGGTEPFALTGDRRKSLIFHASKLATVIKQFDLGWTRKWLIIARVWVELLSYAAANCIPITHVQQLSRGGEFLSLVWLLMTHLGLAKQFQIKEGHAREKLIVGEEDQLD